LLLKYCKINERAGRISREATNYLDSILHSPDFVRAKDDLLGERVQAKAKNENVDLLLKYCKMNERAVRISGITKKKIAENFNTIYDYNDKIRFAHFDLVNGYDINWDFASDALKVMPRLIVVSMPGDWNELCVQSIELFASIAPIVIINFDYDGTGDYDVRSNFFALPAHSIIVIRYLRQMHKLDKPYFRVLIDEPLRQYLFIIYLSRDPNKHMKD
jgi:hypothetical protein